MSLKVKIINQLRHAFFESGPSCVQLLYALRSTLLGAMLLFGFKYFQWDALAILNTEYTLWGSGMLIVGFIGVLSLILDYFKGAVFFTGANVFIYGYLGFSCMRHSYYMSGVNWLFEMLVACWLAFRIQYDYKKQRKDGIVI